MIRKLITKYGSTENIFALAFLIFSLVPLIVSSDYTINNMSNFYISTLLCISLALVWGFCGIFSFAQAAFFGIGGYTYSIMAMNFSSGSTLLALLVGTALAGLVALVLGYFMFYGGINDVFVGLITLCFTLAVETFLSQTAGPQWKIGKVGIGGYNGITNVPGIAIGSFTLNSVSFYALVIVLVFALYFAFRRMQHSKWGYALVAIRENRERCQLFGYNISKIQMLVFGLGGAIAGLSGVLYASWGSYINPKVMDLTPATIPVVLVAAGGRKNLTGAVIFSFIYYWLSQNLSAGGSEFALVILGVILILVIEFVPQGIFASLFDAIDHTIKKAGKGGKMNESIE